jgi:hypothetical protein
MHERAAKVDAARFEEKFIRTKDKLKTMSLKDRMAA